MKSNSISITILILFFLGVSLFNGCKCQEIHSISQQQSYGNKTEAQEKSFNVQCIGTSDGAINVESADIAMWNRSHVQFHIRAKANPNASVEFLGQQYEGKYRYSIVEKYNTYESDYYGFEGGYFAIHEKTGELILFCLMDSHEGDISSENCEKKAREMASQWIPVDEYAIANTSREDGYFYSFCFERKFGELGSCAKLSFGFSTSGELVTFQKMMTDEMEETLHSSDQNTLASLLQAYQSKEAEDAVMEALYEQLNQETKVQSIKKEIIILPNDRLGMVCTVECYKELLVDDMLDFIHSTMEYLVIYE